VKRIRFGAAVLTLSITLLGCRSPDKDYQTIKKQIDTEAYDLPLRMSTMRSIDIKHEAMNGYGAFKY